jgi:hypothetical protein
MSNGPADATAPRANPRRPTANASVRRPRTHPAAFHDPRAQTRGDAEDRRRIGATARRRARPRHGLARTEASVSRAGGRGLREWTNPLRSDDFRPARRSPGWGTRYHRRGPMPPAAAGAARSVSSRRDVLTALSRRPDLARGRWLERGGNGMAEAESRAGVDLMNLVGSLGMVEVVRAEAALLCVMFGKGGRGRTCWMRFGKITTGGDEARGGGVVTATAGHPLGTHALLAALGSGGGKEVP